MNAIAADHPSYRIGLPQIGSGLAGGDWRIIYSILSDAFAERNATIVYYQAGNKQGAAINSALLRTSP